MSQLVTSHGEVGTCHKCDGPLDTVPMGTSDRSMFSFAMTHRKDGTPIKHLDTEGPFLGTLELGWCPTCEEYTAILDSMCDQPEEWKKLPKWEQPI
jgi:hypothetical protein